MKRKPVRSLATRLLGIENQLDREDLVSAEDMVYEVNLVRDQLGRRIRVLEDKMDPQAEATAELMARIQKFEDVSKLVWKSQVHAAKSMSDNLKRQEGKLEHLHNRLAAVESVAPFYRGKSRETATEVGSREVDSIEPEGRLWVSRKTYERQRLLIEKYQHAFHILDGTLDGVRLRGGDDGMTEEEEK